MKSGLASLLDDDDRTWQERVLAKRISNVENLLLPLKETYPALYHKFIKLPLISNKYKHKKKGRNSTGGRRMRENKEVKETVESTRGLKKRAESYDSRSERAFSATEMQLCHMVAKCISEHSLNSYLLTIICLLQHDTEHADSDGISSLAVGNLLAVLFEPAQAPGAEALQSPFHSLLRLIPKHNTPAKTPSDGFKYGTPEEKGQLSLASYLGHSDVASNVGSVLAEHGTETASMEDADDDMTEEDLLAQALAMSLGEASHASEPSNTDRAVSERPESPGSVFTQDERPTEELITIPDLPPLHPLDPFAPFADVMYWKSVIGEHAAHVPSLPLEVCITALFVMLGASADAVLDVETSRAKSTPIQLHVPMFPQSATFELLYVLLDMLLGRIFEAHASGKHSKAHQFHLWCVTQCLKLLQANFLAASADGLLDDVCISRDGEACTLCHGLLVHIATCLGRQVNPTAVPATKTLDDICGMVGDHKSSLKHVRRGICICAIDALSAGFHHLVPSQKMRLCLLQSMFESSKLNTSVVVSKYASSRFCTFENDSYSPTAEYFSALMLQKMCVSYVRRRRQYVPPVSNGEKSDRSDDSDDLSSRQSPIRSEALSTLSEANRTRVMEHLRALIPSGIDPSDRILERMFSAVVNAHEAPSYSSQATPTELSDDESVGKAATPTLNTTHDDTLNSLELLLEESLVDRLSSSFLMQDANKNTSTDISLETCLFFGEFQLLRFLQSNYESLLLHQQIGEKLKTQFLSLEFDPSCTNGLIQCDNHYTTIKQQRSNTWATIKSAKVLPPHSGEYMWSIIVNKCERGHIFLGVASAEAKSDVYLGRDKHGWGLLGTKSLWHGRSKINTNYGETFREDMMVHVKYDSNRGRLSYSTDKAQWGIAFENIPDINIYPAVSLYHGGDSVTAVAHLDEGDDVSLPASDCSDTSASSPVAGFISYSTRLIEIVEHLLCEVGSSDNDTEKRKALLLHPYISVLMPALFASIVKCSCNSRVGCTLSIHLLPQLTVIIKRLAQLSEVYDSEINQFIDQSCDGFIGNVSGDWMISSAAAGGAIPAQEYTVTISVADVLQGDVVPKPLHRPISVAGQGEGRIPAVSIAGNVYGTRVHFDESWAMGGTCTVDGRFSLDGNDFSGCYKDVKSGIVGTLSAHRRSRLRGFQTQNYLLKASILASMACGKLIAHLIVGMTATESNQVNELDVMSAKDPHEESLLEEHKDDVEEDTGAASLAEGASDSNTESLLRHWIKSELLSGGLSEDKPFIDGISDQLRSYCLFDDTLLKPRSSTMEVKTWWMQQVLPWRLSE